MQYIKLSDGSYREFITRNKYVKRNGVWIPAYSDYWRGGAWGECQAECEQPGLQHRPPIYYRVLKGGEKLFMDRVFAAGEPDIPLQKSCIGGSCGRLTTRFSNCQWCCSQYSQCTSGVLYMEYEVPPEKPGINDLYFDCNLTYSRRRSSGTGYFKIIDYKTGRSLYYVASNALNYNVGSIGSHWSTYHKSGVRHVSCTRKNQHLGEIVIPTEGITKFQYRAWTRRRNHAHVFHMWNMKIRAVYNRPLS